MQQCGFCSMLSGLLRRAMCLGSRRGSSESYYQELGDQEALKCDIEDAFDLIGDDNLPMQSFNSKCSDGNVQITEAEWEMLEAIKNKNRYKVQSSHFLTMQKRRRKRLVTRSLVQQPAVLDDILHGQVQCMLVQSVKWSFNAFMLENVTGGRSLPVLCVHLFHWYGLLEHFRLDVARVWKLFSLIEEGYHSTNPYHNSIHATDVTQAMHCFLQQEKVKCNMEPLEIMASIIAAVAHDVDHPGVNQPFLIATSNHLAALYENTSVLENHHWRSAISCLLESGISEQLKDVHVQLESQISSLILATDITRQQEFLAKFKNLMDTSALDMNLKEHRHFVLQIALKCADISNPCRPWDISRKWSLKVCEEFFRQGDYERKLNLPVTALCDRHTTSIPKIQAGFFKFVVTPLVDEWHKFLQSDLSLEMMKNLNFNQVKWEGLLQQEIAEETCTEISDAEILDDDIEEVSTEDMSESGESLHPLKTVIGSFCETTRGVSRRFSMPVSTSNKFFHRRDSLPVESKSLLESSNLEEDDESLEDSDHSLHSTLSITVRLHRKGSSSKTDLQTSSEHLQFEHSIASITTSREANRLSSVLRGNVNAARLLRQQTFPPLQAAVERTRLLSSAGQPSTFIDTSNDSSPTRSDSSKTDISQTLLDMNKHKKDEIIINTDNMYKIKKTDQKEEYSTSLSEGKEKTNCNVEKENLDPSSGKGKSNCNTYRRCSVPISGYIDEKQTTNNFLRRGSVPVEAISLTVPSSDLEKMEIKSEKLSMIRKMLESEGTTVRRGSAPIISPSDVRFVRSLTGRHSLNAKNWSRKGAYRFNNGNEVENVACSGDGRWHNWLQHVNCLEERPLAHLRRRGSLPIEALAITS